ncbi:MAG: ABC transporter ATP-binding protein [Brevinema sp.]
MILNKPNSALDYENKRRLFEILEQFKKEKLIIMSSHDPELACKHVDFIIPFITRNVAPAFSAKHLTDDKITQVYSL